VSKTGDVRGSGIKIGHMKRLKVWERSCEHSCEQAILSWLMCH